MDLSWVRAECSGGGKGITTAVAGVELPSRGVEIFTRAESGVYGGFRVWRGASTTDVHVIVVLVGVGGGGGGGETVLITQTQNLSSLVNMGGKNPQAVSCGRN